MMRTALMIALFSSLAPLSLISCTRANHAAAPANPNVQVGQTTQQLVDTKGQPAAVTASVQRPAAQLYRYKDGTVYQSENGTVVGQFEDPVGDEKTLQYWRQLWKGKNFVIEDMPETRDPHGRVDVLYRLPDEKIAVVYDPAKDAVLRVVHYGN
jgi:hypothetical protein